MSKTVRWALRIIASAAAVIAGILGLRALGRALARPVKAGDPFVPIPGKKRKIAVTSRKTGETRTVELPKGMKSKDVESAELSEKKNVTIEVNHEKIDLSDHRHGGGDTDFNL